MYNVPLFPGKIRHEQQQTFQVNHTMNCMQNVWGRCIWRYMFTFYKSHIEFTKYFQIVAILWVLFEKVFSLLTIWLQWLQTVSYVIILRTALVISVYRRKGHLYLGKLAIQTYLVIWSDSSSSQFSGTVEIIVLERTGEGKYEVCIHW